MNPLIETGMQYWVEGTRMLANDPVFVRNFLIGAGMIVSAASYRIYNSEDSVPEEQDLRLEDIRVEASSLSTKHNGHTWGSDNSVAARTYNGRRPNYLRYK